MRLSTQSLVGPGVLLPGLGGTHLVHVCTYLSDHIIQCFETALSILHVEKKIHLIISSHSLQDN